MHAPQNTEYFIDQLAYYYTVPYGVAEASAPLDARRIGARVNLRLLLQGGILCTGLARIDRALAGPAGGNAGEAAVTGTRLRCGRGCRSGQRRRPCGLDAWPPLAAIPAQATLKRSLVPLPPWEGTFAIFGQGQPGARGSELCRAVLSASLIRPSST